MSYQPPTLPANFEQRSSTRSTSRLRNVSERCHDAEEPAEHKERETRLEEKADQDEVEERPDVLPDDVPGKATITIKEINDNRYYYWQWRGGEKVRSQYKGPVNPDE